MERTEVVLDSDFLQSILSNSSVDFFKQLMNELNVRPVVHSYVAEVELQYCNEAKALIDEGCIRKVKYDEYLFSENERNVYNENVWAILDFFSEKDLPPEEYRDVFRTNFRLTEYSIGEILSELMAASLKIPLFASNDFGAKRIAMSRINNARYHLDVKNLAELLEIVGSRCNGLKWKDIKNALRDGRWEKKRRQLWALWNK